MLNRNPHGELASMQPASLRKVRALLQMTQEELGAALGVTKTEIYRKESSETHRQHRPITRVQVLALRWLLHVAGYSDHQITKLAGKD